MVEVVPRYQLEVVEGTLVEVMEGPLVEVVPGHFVPKVSGPPVATVSQSLIGTEPEVVITPAPKSQPQTEPEYSAAEWRDDVPYSDAANKLLKELDEFVRKTSSITGDD